MSNAPAPTSPTSSFVVKTSSTPACGRPSATIRLAPSSIAATAALLSPPRIVPAALRTTPSSTTGSIGPSGGTVSRWAQKKIGTPAVSAPGSLQKMLPASDSIAGPLPSSSQLRPTSLRYAPTRSATSRSLPDGLGIAASSRKRSRTDEGTCRTILGEPGLGGSCEISFVATARRHNLYFASPPTRALRGTRRPVSLVPAASTARSGRLPAETASRTLRGCLDGRE